MISLIKQIMCTSMGEGRNFIKTLEEYNEKQSYLGGE